LNPRRTLVISLRIALLNHCVGDALKLKQLKHARRFEGTTDNEKVVA
jgi:hypothetical protein